jgi:hypothetical protein
MTKKVLVGGTIHHVHIFTNSERFYIKIESGSKGFE